ncbi:MAG TPA: response regulator transcription factor [Myxococcaceae bacterium]|nr:response regulator transcription factor [Myxococcaceae bacterium]
MPESNIAILSDRSLFREGVTQFLQSHGFQQLTEYAVGAQLLSALELYPPRLVLIDMEHSSDAPFPLLQEVRRRAPGCAAMILGAGASSASMAEEATRPTKFLELDIHLLTAVAGVAARSEESASPAESQQQRQRWSALTPRQRDVLGYLSTGSDNLKIAAHLGISERAVKAHVSALLSVFSAENRTELAVLACRAGVRPPVRSRPTPVPAPVMHAASRSA